MALPYFTAHLTPEDYGLFAVFSMACMFIGNFQRLELNIALKREYAADRTAFSIFLSTAFMVSALLFFVSISVAALGYLFFDTFYGIPWHWILLICCLAFFRFQTIALHHIWQITNKAVYYGLWGVLVTLSVYGVAIALLHFLHLDWRARAWGEWLVGFITFLLALVLLRRNFGLGWKFNMAAARKMLRLSLPLVPNGLLSYIFLVSDRVFLAEHRGAHELGIYAVSLQLAAVMSLVFGSVSPVWESWLFRQFKRWDITAKKETFSRLAVIATVAMLVAFVLSKLLPVISPYILNKNFEQSVSFLFPCLVAATAAGLYALTNIIIVFTRKTVFLAFVNVIMLVLNLVLMSVFVPQYGASGAAYSLAATYLFGLAVLVAFAAMHEDETLRNSI